MKIQVDRIPEAGVEVQVVDLAWADAAAAAAFEAPASATGALNVVAFGDQVRVNGTLTLTGTRPCDRCGNDMQVELVEPVELYYVPGGSRDESPSRELKADELDIGFYDGGAIDLAAVVEEHFALSMPSRLACDAPGTRVADGASCGASEPDAENEKRVDPRFAVLAGLKLNDDNGA